MYRCGAEGNDPDAAPTISFALTMRRFHRIKDHTVDTGSFHSLLRTPRGEHRLSDQHKSRERCQEQRTPRLLDWWSILVHGGPSNWLILRLSPPREII